jgi:hypothetical protein
MASNHISLKPMDFSSECDGTQPHQKVHFYQYWDLSACNGSFSYLLDLQPHLDVEFKEWFRDLHYRTSNDRFSR